MKQKGFTIVELIVVIVVIGILASIVVVSYNGVQNNAYNTAVQSNLEDAAGQLEAYRTQQTNTSQQFPNTTAQLSELQIKASKDSYNTTLATNFVYCVDSTRQSFALVAASKANTVYMMTEDGFRSNALTTANFTASLCSSLGLTLVSNGYASGSWQAWVKS